MARKKTVFSEIDLLWAETQLATWKEYVDKNPIAKLRDRFDPTTGKLVQNIEGQGNYIQNLMKNYLLLLKEIDAMRETEEAKQILVRGDNTLSPFERGEL